MRIKEKEIIIPTGEKIILRSAKKEDAESVCAHKYITSEESYYMARYPEECEHDVSAIETRLSDIEKHPQNFSVTAFKDGKVIGDLGVTQIRNHIKFRHRAYMGISIQKKYWNCGLGSQMVDIAVKQAKENGFEQLELGVFADNERAIHLYEKFGFQNYGVQPRAFKLKDGTYHDEVIMVRIF
ncbi:MAG: GNAT family N-acetyltransferase [Ruminococcus sp.]|nr:GNAT family N-acetyltransferase [Ruminococcus sp.]